VLNWLAEIIDALPQEDNGLLTLPLLLKLSHAIIDIGEKKKKSSSAVSPIPNFGDAASCSNFGMCDTTSRPEDRK
jgi:hypothetical protein